MSVMHNLLKRIEIRLNRSEVNNYLSSIYRTPALKPEGTVAIKAEPRDEEELLPFIVKIESPHNPEQEDLGSKVKGFNCPSCQLTFKYRLHLSHHLNTNNSCVKECSQTSDVKTEDTDTSNSNAQVKHSCPKCKKELKSSDGLRRHMWVHKLNPKRLYSCSTCRQRFKHEHSFLYHAQHEHLFKCEYCELAFPYKSNLDGHMNSYHQDRITNMGPSVGIEDGNRGTTVFQHEQLFKCLNCELSFLKKASVEAHVLKWHPEETRSKSKGYNILNLNDKARNNSTVASVSQPEHYCPECKKEFASFSGLYNHTTSFHSIERPYVCSTCQHTFKSLAERDLHARNEHRFQCVNCELSFVRKHSLEEHAIKYHQPVTKKHLICPECKKEFSTRANLRAHKRVHSNERLYVCSTCLHTFKHKKNLTVHCQRDHGSKCDKCTLSFLSQKDLTQHLSQHTTEGDKAT